MSQVGERKDAPEIEDVEDAGQSVEQGADEPGSDESDADDIGEESDDGDADHGDDDDAGEDEGQGGQPPQVVVKKGNPEFGALRKKAREASEKADRLEREMNELRQQRQHAQTEAERRAEAERIAVMLPEEKTEYLLNKQKQEFDGRFGQLQFQMQDNADRVAFDSLCARDPALAAVRDEAEQKLQELRRQGGTSSREIIATYLIGQKARERAAKGGFAKQKAKGKERVASAKSQPTGGRSDVRGGERRGGDERAARAARLGDVQI